MESAPQAHCSLYELLSVLEHACVSPAACCDPSGRELVAASRHNSGPGPRMLWSFHRRKRFLCIHDDPNIPKVGSHSAMAVPTLIVPSFGCSCFCVDPFPRVIATKHGLDRNTCLQKELLAPFGATDHSIIGVDLYPSFECLGCTVNSRCYLPSTYLISVSLSLHKWLGSIGCHLPLGDLTKYATASNSLLKWSSFRTREGMSSALSSGRVTFDRIRRLCHVAVRVLQLWIRPLIGVSLTPISLRASLNMGCTSTTMEPLRRSRLWRSHWFWCTNSPLKYDSTVLPEIGFACRAVDRLASWFVKRLATMDPHWTLVKHAGHHPPDLMTKNIHH